MAVWEGPASCQVLSICLLTNKRVPAKPSNRRAVLEWLQQVSFSDIDDPFSAGNRMRDYDAWLSSGRSVKGMETVLISLLELHDKRVNESQVAYALGWLGSAKSVPVLMGSLDSSDAGLRTEAAAALGRLRARSATEALCRILSVDPDRNVRANAAAALGRIGGRKSESCLERALSDPDDFVKQLAREALHRK